MKALTHLTGVISLFHRKILKEENEEIMAMMAWSSRWTSIKHLCWVLFELFIADTNPTHVKISARIHKNHFRNF